MSTTETVLPLPTLSSEVQTFATEKGVAAFLPAVNALARRLFPHTPIRVVVEGDPELSYNTQIVFEVDTVGMDGQQMLAAYGQWSHGLFQDCPATHVHVFCLIQRP